MRPAKYSSGTLLLVSFILLSGILLSGENKFPQQFKIHVDQPAYTGMPIWIHADLPESLVVRYPYSEDLASTGPNRLELKHNGRMLTPSPLNEEPDMSGRWMGQLHPHPRPRIGCLYIFPINYLHIPYQLKEHGTYAVRWTELRHGLENGHLVEKIVAQSEWTTFEVRQPTNKQRKTWIRQELAMSPSDPGVLVGDHLPNLLAAASDSRVLRVLLDQLYSPSDLVSSVALNGLRFFPEEQMANEALSLMQRRGPNQPMAYLVSWHPRAFQKFQREIVRIALAGVQSDTPKDTAGSLKILMFVAHRPTSDFPINTPLVKSADEQVLAAAPSIIAHGDSPSAQTLAEYLGQIKTDRARDLLWQIAERRSGAEREQATIALTWIGDERDLSRLADWLVAPGDQDGYGRDRAGLAYMLVHAWGDKSIPYLEKALSDSPYAFVRTQCAEELVLQGRQSAFPFFLDAVENNRFYKQEMLGWLKQHYSSQLLPDADDATVAAFLKSRISQR